MTASARATMKIVTTYTCSTCGDELANKSDWDMHLVMSHPVDIVAGATINLTSEVLCLPIGSIVEDELGAVHKLFLISNREGDPPWWYSTADDEDRNAKDLAARGPLLIIRVGE